MENYLFKRSLCRDKYQYENQNRFFLNRKCPDITEEFDYIINLKDLSVNMSYHELHAKYMNMKNSLSNFKYFVNWPVMIHKKNYKISFNNLILRERKRKINVDKKYIIEALENFEENQFSLVKLLANYNNTHPQEKIKYSTLHRRVKNELKFNFKENEKGMIKKNIKELLPENILYITHLINFIKMKYEIIYFDESTIKNFVKRKKIWRRSKHKFYKKNKKFTERKINLLYCCNLKKSVHYMLTNTNTNGNIVIRFLNKTLDKIPNFQRKRLVFILDNARYHCKERLLEFAVENQCQFLFLPRYSPYCNLSEYAFCSIKREFKKYSSSNYNTRKKFESLIDNIIKRIKYKEFKTIFNHFLKFLNKAIHDIILSFTN